MAELTLCVGATGAQGGSVARSLLRAGSRVRALTRNPTALAARRLAALGASVEQGDLSDLARLTELMEGCDSAFGVTSYWEHFGNEIAHGKNLVDAAVQAKLSHLVLSTLPSPERLSRGRMFVPHMESKAAIETYARNSPLCCSFVHVAFQFENFGGWFAPRVDRDGVLSIGFPCGEAPLAGVAIDDLGPVVVRIIRERARFRGETVAVVGDELRGEQLAAELSRGLGQEVRYTLEACEASAQLPTGAARELAAMFAFERRFAPSRRVEIEATRALFPGAQRFSTWVTRQSERLRSALGLSD